jgi:amino acid transporter
LEIINLCYICLIAVLHIDNYWCFILRKKEPDTERPYKAFGYPFVPAIYIVVTVAICITLLVYDTFNTGLGLGIVALEFRFIT